MLRRNRNKKFIKGNCLKSFTPEISEHGTMDARMNLNSVSLQILSPNINQNTENRMSPEFLQHGKNCRCLRIWFVQLSSFQCVTPCSLDNLVFFSRCKHHPFHFGPLFPTAGSMNVISDPLSNQNIFAGILFTFAELFRFTLWLLTVNSTPPTLILIPRPCLHYSHHLSKFFCVCY